MPRSGWLAIGATAAALAGPAAAAALGSRAPLGLVAVGIVLLGLALVGAGTNAARPRQIAALAVGAAAIALRLAVAGGGAEPAPPLPDGAGPWSAIVEGVGTPRDGQQVATIRLDSEGGLRVAATLPRYPAIAPGDAIRLAGRLQPPPADDGGYGTYLRRIGVAATVRARTLDLLPGAATPADRLEDLRRASGEALARALPEPEAGLAAGILIGLRDRVDRDLAAAFTTAGVSHIVAISGWNIAIVAAVVGALLRSRLGRRGRSLVTLAAIVAYTLFAGASPSVVRAAVMAAVVLLARESGRAGAAATALGWAATLLLVAEPRTVGDAGFQLSVLATAGLIAWGTALTERLRAWRGGRLPGWLAESLGVSLAAQAATLPVVLAGFGRLAILAPAVNLAVVPLVAPAMATGAAALAGGWLTLAGAPAIVGTLVGLPGWLVLTILVAIVRFAAGLPFASVTLPPPFGAVAGIAVGAIMLAAASGRLRRPDLSRLRKFRRRRIPAGDPRPAVTGTGAGPPGGRLRPGDRGPRPGRPARLLATALALSVAAVGISAANRPDGLVHVTVLDVGQGDAILVEGGRGGRLLVDGGPDPDRLLVELDARVPPWDRRIDLLILTHPHEDHVAGLALLLERYRVGRVFAPEMTGPGPGYRAWLAALDRLGLRPAPLSTGDTFGLDGIGFRVLWPDPGTVPRQPADGGTAINNVSIVLLGTVGRQRFLLAGDIEEGIDPILIARGLPRLDLLKVAHHGSRTSSTGAFLDAVRPRLAVVSAGARNPYGHPAPATLARFAERGVRLFRTDRDGSVEVTLDGLGRLEVRPDRRAARTGQPPATEPPVAAAPRGVPLVAFSCGVPAASG
jgi:competence protein ComEC